MDARRLADASDNDRSVTRLRSAKTVIARSALEGELSQVPIADACTPGKALLFAPGCCFGG